MNQPQIILVTGATGAQGGSVAHSLLKQNKFKVRALTRNPNSQKAKDLAAAGAEIFEGDLNDIESLKLALKDCYGVFGVTNFWEHFEQEYQQGKNLIDAVRQAGIKHFVYSSLPDYSQLSGGELSVPHCDIKAQLEAYAKNLGIPSTFVHIAFYYENFLNFFPLQPGGDGNYYFGFPQGDTKLAMVSVEDMGGIVAPIFDHPLEYIGRVVGIVGEDSACTDYAATMSKVFEKNIFYNHISRNEFAAYPFNGAEELANMFDVQRRFIPNRQLHLIETYGLYPATQSFESWLKNNTQKFEGMFAKAAPEMVG